MPQHVLILQLTGVAVLVLATVAWVIGLTRILRQTREQTAELRSGHPLPTLPALPRQRQVGPALESTALTPAEEDAFAGLVRQLGGC
ncbi:hypothetical protein ABT124_02460 [Streptomyces sp. NPDC001982]|uniref:hypothetical protein n=1 Tax=Streptomyces sp. NPDC001982 TaxID=3154405 RepID=UPI00332675B2